MNKNLKFLLATICFKLINAHAVEECNYKLLDARADAYVQRMIEELPYPTRKLETQLDFINIPENRKAMYKDDFQSLEERIHRMEEDPMIAEESNIRDFFKKLIRDYQEFCNQESTDDVNRHAAYMLVNSIVDKLKSNFAAINQTRAVLKNIDSRTHVHPSPQASTQIKTD